MSGRFRAEGVVVEVDGSRLIDGVTLFADPGEMVALVGPNGAGKSTLLAVVAGDRHPTEGIVTMDGIAASELTLDDLSRRRSVLTQDLPNDIAFRVADLVEMGRHPHRNSPDNSAAKDRATVSAAIAETGLIGWEQRIVATLSGGERLRSHLARVLAQDTPIILLDEPTAALDVAHQEHVLALCERKAREGRTVVTVLHDLNAAARYASRIVVLDQGRVVADGNPHQTLTGDLLSEVYRQPMVVVDHPHRDCPLVLVVDA